MNYENNEQKIESVYSTRIRAGKRRTYFFDVRTTRDGDYYLTITESKKRMDGGYDRSRIYLYKEDFNSFLKSLTSVIDHVKGMMPGYDFDEFAKKQEEYERLKAEQIANGTWDPSKQNSNSNENYGSDSPRHNSGSEENIGSAPPSDSSAPASNDEELKW